MLNNFKPYLIIILIGCTIIIIFLSYLFIDRDEEIFITNEEVTTTTILNQNFFVDVKGSVKKPGVYEFKNGDRVIDQTTPNMIQRISGIFERNPLIYGDI